ncbi:MAG: hypothetical protein P8P30_05165 [Rickettsiales bacterium]|nr:hypothetical protein [Rickettsiales bacterium]
MISTQGGAVNEKITAEIVRANQQLAKTQSFTAISKARIAELKSNPSSLLEAFPKGGPKMAKYVARAASTDSSLVESILKASQQATFDQASAIGAGLARAVRGSLTKLIKSISEQVAQLGSLSTQISYNAVGPIQSAGSQVIPEPVRIGLADASGGSFNLSPHTGGGLAGSKGLPHQIGSKSSSLTQYAQNTQRFSDMFSDPWKTVSIVALEADDNGATSTSPTR